MKKFRLILVAALAAITISSVCFAEYGISDYPALHEKQAQFLFELGLFKGTDKGFELDRVASRGEIAVMLTRLLGAESEAIEQNNVSPFTDVPEWCAPHVGWLYQNGYTNGIGDNKYGTDMQTICDNYATFLSRIVYGATIEKPATIAGKTRFYPQLSQERWNTLLTRGDAVEVSVWALESQMGKTPETLMQNLIRRNVVTEEKVLAVAPIIYLPDRLHSKLLPEHEVSRDFFQMSNVLYKRGADGSKIEIDRTVEPKNNVWLHLYSTEFSNYFFKNVDNSTDQSIIKYEISTGKTTVICNSLNVIEEFRPRHQEVDNNILYFCFNNTIASLDLGTDILNTFKTENIGEQFSILDNNIFLINFRGEISKSNKELNNEIPIFMHTNKSVNWNKLFLHPDFVLSYNEDTIVFQDESLYKHDLDISPHRYEYYTYKYNIKTDVLECISVQVKEPHYVDSSITGPLEIMSEEFKQRMESHFKMTVAEYEKKLLADTKNLINGAQ